MVSADKGKGKEDPEVGSLSTSSRDAEKTDSEPRPSTFKWKPFAWWRRIIFAEVDAFILHGYRHRLEPDDAYVEPSVVTDSVNASFQPAWEAQLKKPKPSLKRAIVAGNLRTVLVSGLLYGIAQATSLAGPLLLQRIVAGISCQAYGGGAKCEPKNNLYFYCIGLFLAPVLQSLCENHCNFMLYVMGTRARNTLMAAIYRKCLKLSNSSLQAESPGRVITLMSNDAQKLQDAAFAIHAMWASPALIIAILVLLWYQVGWATFVGLAIMLLLVPATAFLAAKLASFRKELLQWTDKRVGLMSEVISGIQMIKFYAWEVPFQTDVMKFRNKEAEILRRQAVWQGWFGVLLFMGPILVAVFCFGSYSIAGETLTPANAYAALSFFSLLRFPMSFLPMLITMIVNALVALRRIRGFLLRSEAKLDKADHEGVVAGEVKVKDAEFAWDDAAEKPTLTGINFDAKPGSLTMIVGSVGSGKSSLVGALIGSMHKRSGSVTVGGRISYVAQSSWIMNDTLQENVLMGEAMDPERYRSALKDAQLGPDLKILPQGDLTEIGDRGVTLSGGQKQRVSMARALYYDADVYLLDDPLSAVDSHVGRALFDKCIKGRLKNKTVLLVTNALQYLPAADNVIWLEDGVIRGQGTFLQLQAQGMNMQELAHMDEDEVKEAGSDTFEIAEVPAAAPSKDKDTKKIQLEGATSLDNNITLTKKAGEADRNLTGVEAREVGNVGLNVITRYIVCGGGTWVVLSIVALFALEQGARAYTDRWVGIWFSDPYGYGITPGWFYLGIYFALGLAYGLLTFIRTIDFLFFTVRGAVNLHNGLLAHILMLPKSFFDTNPSGRIINRFSRDTDIMDTALPQTLIQFAGCIAILIANIVVIAIATRWFAIAIPPLLVIYFFIQRYYIPTAREMQRIESITRSPIYSKFGEALQGVPTIRAYRKEAFYTLVSDQLMERNANAYCTQKLAAAWLAMRLDVLGVLVLVGTGALCISGGIDPGLAGLAILYALDLTRYLKHATNMASQSEAQFNSAERIIQYMDPTPEADPDTKEEVMRTLPPGWPVHGAVEVKDLVMRYRPEMPLVLKGISFSIAAGEKVGLVGRTGSGKSSIFLALFRMVEPEGGAVFIDGVDTKSVGVRHLRSRMSIIPQDPFLYKGSVRRNLDPLSNHKDEELWTVLEDVGLKHAIVALEAKLDHQVVDNGANFSLGQRQLFCLARAMLRHSKILMLDEATASMDLESDATVQSAIRFKFEECTMLTIAHRLNTVMDADRVLVLDDGRVVENDEPDTLLKKHNGVFGSFVAQTGRSSSRYLKGLAASAKQSRSLRATSSANARATSVFNTEASLVAAHPELGPANKAVLLGQEARLHGGNGMTPSFNVATAPSDSSTDSAPGQGSGAADEGGSVLGGGAARSDGVSETSSALSSPSATLGGALLSPSMQQPAAAAAAHVPPATLTSAPAGRARGTTGSGPGRLGLEPLQEGKESGSMELPEGAAAAALAAKLAEDEKRQQL